MKKAGALALGTALPGAAVARAGQMAKPEKKKAPFKYCLNTSTISGQKPGLLRYVDIAAGAGYDSLELWIRDIQAYVSQGSSLASLDQHIRDAGLTVENTIGFAPWMVADATERATGFKQLEEEMEMLARIGCKRIAAPPAGVKKGQPVDLLKAGEYYRQALELGRKTGVMPQLEFWGSSGTVYHLGQALAIAAAANDPDARLLPDIYHLFRGGSGFEGLKMLRGSLVEVFHLNDYVLSKPREEQKDSDRVYPGDGDGPVRQVLADLRKSGGTKVLSLELFNPGYWQQDPLLVAKTGLKKMKEVSR